MDWKVIILPTDVANTKNNGIMYLFISKVNVYLSIKIRIYIDKYT